MKPQIGITLDIEEKTGPAAPRYLLRSGYARAIEAAGGLAYGLPHVAAEAETYADRLDGLVITGGAFDIDPALFGAEERHASIRTKAERTRFEMAIAKAMLARNKPILGICGGEQLLNVIFGGTLIQHIEDEIADSLLHEQPNPRDEPGHKARIVQPSLLHRIVDAEEIAVNSAHHQAVKTIGKDLRVNAIAPDGVIEGIESTAHRFCLGVQWHPEFAVSAADRRIFAAFVAAAQ